MNNDDTPLDQLESYLFAHAYVKDEDLDGKVITCDKNDVKYPKFMSKLVEPFPEHIIAAKTIENGEKIVQFSSRNTLKIRNASNFEVLQEIQCDYYATSICALILGDSLKNMKIFFGSVLGEMIEWDVVKGKTPSQRNGHKGMIFSIVSDGTRIFSISDDRSIRMWLIDSEVNGPIYTAYGHTARPFAICVDPTNRRIYTGGIEQTILIWEYTDTEIKPLRKVQLSIGVIRKITLLNAKTLLIGSHTGSLIELDITEKPEIEELRRDIVSFGRFDGHLAILDKENIVTVFDDNDKAMCRMEEMKNLVSCDESMICWNKTLVFFVQREKVFRLVMSANVISAVVHDSYALITMTDRTTRIYNFINSSTVELLKTITFPKPSIISSVFTVVNVKNQKCLVIGSTHGEIYHGKLDGEDQNVEFSLDRRLCNEISGKKEITCIKAIDEDDGCFMILTKIGGWCTFRVDENDEKLVVTLLNSRTFTSNNHMGWPSKFVSTFMDKYIVGFYGTSLVIWDCHFGAPIYEVYCGGGHRVWQISESIEKTTELNFDFIRSETLFRQRIPVNMIKHIVHAPHSSPIVCGAGSENYLATVSLDGNLVVTQGWKPDCYDHVPIFTMFAGENLLCNDILEDTDDATVYITTGGGKSKLAVWRFDDAQQFETNTFWLRSVCRPDEGRIVATRIVKMDGVVYFIASFSSAFIEIFKITQNELESVGSVRMEEDIGIGQKMIIQQNSTDIRLIVGTSGSYLIDYQLKNDGTLEFVGKIKLTDRSGITALCPSESTDVIVGCDSGGVYRITSSRESQEVHRHLSTVVGIQKDGEKISSVSLDCAILVSNGMAKLRRIPTVLDMPGGMTSVGQNCTIILGDGLQTFSL